MSNRVTTSKKNLRLVPSRGWSENSFLPAYVVFLVVIQAVYANVYARSPFLRESPLLQIGYRLAAWTLPVIIHLIISGRDVLGYLRLRHGVLRGAAWGIIVGLLLVALNLTATIVSRGHARINFLFGQSQWWKAVILVGFSEEVVFRGYLLREFAEKTRFWIANTAQAVLFLAVHICGWIILGKFVFPGILRDAGYVFFVGIFLGMVWKRSRSLWACMLIHSFSNFCSFAIT